MMVAELPENERGRVLRFTAAPIKKPVFPQTPTSTEETLLRWVDYLLGVQMALRERLTAYIKLTDVMHSTLSHHNSNITIHLDGDWGPGTVTVPELNARVDKELADCQNVVEVFRELVTLWRERPIDLDARLDMALQRLEGGHDARTEQNTD